MSKERPYFQSTGKELATLFQENKSNPKILNGLLAELKHRKRPKSVALRENVAKAISTLERNSSIGKIEVTAYTSSDIAPQKKRVSQMFLQLLTTTPQVIK
jgi:hypothetical protein